MTPKESARVPELRDSRIPGENQDGHCEFHSLYFLYRTPVQVR